MKELTVRSNDAGQRLDRFVGKAVPLLPETLLQKYIRLKRIKLNGKGARRDTRRRSSRSGRPGTWAGANCCDRVNVTGSETRKKLLSFEMKFFSLNAWYVPLPVTFGTEGVANPRPLPRRPWQRDN